MTGDYEDEQSQRGYEALDLFAYQADQVRHATDAGIATSYQAAPDDWKTAAAEEVEYLSRALDTFTTDEVIERLELRDIRPANLMALGHVMRQAAKDGLIVNSGERRRTRIARRHRELTVWRSTR